MQVNAATDGDGNLMAGLFFGGTSLILKHLAAVAGLVPFVVLTSYACFKVQLRFCAMVRVTQCDLCGARLMTRWVRGTRYALCGT